MTVVVYTDASYCSQTDVAACGYLILSNGRPIKHEVIFVSGLKTPTNAELFAVVSATQFSFLIKNVKNIIVNTDCKTLLHCRLHKTKKGRVDVSELVETIEIVKEYGVGFSMFFVRGHGGNKWNNKVDISCNLNLRTFLNKQNNEKSISRRTGHNDSFRLQQ